MRCHLATAVTVRTPPARNPLSTAVQFVTRPLSDGLYLSDHLIAGALAAAASFIALHPLDTLKTVIQKSAISPSVSAGAVVSPAKIATAGVSPPRSLNAFSALITTLQNGGIPALYRGLSPCLIGQVPANAIKFAAYESLTQAARVVFPRRSKSIGVDFICGALAFVACSVVLVPSELLKQRLQAGVAGGVRGAISSIIRNGGWRAAYTGYGATLLRDVPYTMLEFGLYRQFKRFARAVMHCDVLTAPQEVALGGIAGGCTGFLTTPLDVAKTRLMTQGSGVARQYSGVFDALVKIGRTEGIPGLFKGSATRVIWLVPFTAVYFGVHEAMKRTLLERRKSAALTPRQTLTYKSE